MQNVRKLLKIFDTPEDVYKCDDKVLEDTGILKKKELSALKYSKRDNSIYEEFIKLKKKGIRFITYEDELYPKRLKNIYDSPVSMYIKGNMIRDDYPSVAIVGARRCSQYGKETAYYFAKRFAQMGIQVVSGMAAGIDSAAHRGCIDGNGKTYAVLGCGVDVCYPACNIELYTMIERTGGIISEYPVGSVPLAWAVSCKKQNNQWTCRCGNYNRSREKEWFSYNC